MDNCLPLWNMVKEREGIQGTKWHSQWSDQKLVNFGEPNSDSESHSDKELVDFEEGCAGDLSGVQ